MTTFNFFIFDPITGVEGVCKDKICASMGLYALFPSFYMQHDYFQKKNVLTFDPTPGVEVVCKDIILLVCFCIRYSL